MAIGSAEDLIAKRGARTNRASRFVFLADETLRLEIENPGVARRWMMFSGKPSRASSSACAWRN
jgi:hypothetical protein